MYIEKIVEQYGRAVYSFALSRLKNESDAADVYQNVFLKLFEKQPHFSSHQKLKSWLMKTTYNCSMDVLRLRARECELSGELISPAYEHDSFFELLEKLPESQRDTVYLYYAEGMKIADIAKTLGISVSGVKTRLSRARLSLKEELQ